ncbi:hypothetical protein ILP92_15225 [Maribius pontilimi]|uniref:Uncharacterized protein n=1 Tax=Palleronia pontilimi TaxID=1964209 RepID=A0A934MF40_9RHOB|nr:DUF6173 family protein [Palleronia pontilimi]MBJ3764101.1 hypothetical protein [Palleronia pontilimi]
MSADRIETAAEAMEAEALPHAHVVHTDPDAKSTEDEPLPKSVTAKPQKAKSPAEWAYQRMVLYIKNFEEQLDDQHEIAMAFAGDASGVMRIEGMGYFDPDIITFYGTDPTGARTQLVQHVSQLSVMLRALPKGVAKEAPRRIGFRLVDDLDAQITVRSEPQKGS